MERPELSRRELLAGGAAAAGAGALVGSGTAAMFSDQESFLDNRMAAGALELDVDWEVAGDSGSGEGNASVPLDLSGGNREGEASVSVSLPDAASNNPAYAWLRTTCPEPIDLVEALDVALEYDDCPDGDPDGDGGAKLADGSLREVATDLRNGVPLDPGCDASAGPGSRDCLQPGERLDLRLEWELDEGYAGEESASFELEFVGRQCRNGDGTTNPFPPAEECEGRSCDCCVIVGKLESSIETGTHQFTEGSSAYEIEILDTDPKGSEATGVEFEVHGTDETPDPELCAVYVKGGPNQLRYDSDLLSGPPNASGDLLQAPRGNDNGNNGNGNDGNGNDGNGNDGNGNDGNDSRKGISYVAVAVCFGVAANGDCPADKASLANSGKILDATADDVGPADGEDQG